VLVCASCGAENREGARFCDSCGAPLSQTVPAREVRKVVTVLFCDVTGSTALGERIDPESLRRVMARYFKSAKAVVERHGGTVGRRAARRHRGDLTGADELIASAADIVDATDYIILHIDLAFARAEVAQIARRPDEQRVALAQALSVAEAKGDLLAAGHARRGLGSL
jgi:class 3 adenylate cyclase